MLHTSAHSAYLTADCVRSASFPLRFTFLRVLRWRFTCRLRGDDDERFGEGRVLTGGGTMVWGFKLVD